MVGATIKEVQDGNQGKLMVSHPGALYCLVFISVISSLALIWTSLISYRQFNENNEENEKGERLEETDAESEESRSLL